MGHVTIIAELGSSPAPAWDFEPWCAAAAAAGADAVKVQLFRADHFPESERVSKQPLEFPRERLPEYVKIARAYGLAAGASVFDEEAVLLVSQHCDFIKLAARERDNAKLRFACEMTIGRSRAIGMSARQVYRSVDGIEFDARDHELILYAIQRYPASLKYSLECLLKADEFYRHMHWGWSSHTTGTLDCILAARLGASVIEKHLAIHPDDMEAGHSLGPSEFAAMCRAIRKGEKHA